jgi:transcription termination/antitermination protein NusG
VTGVASPEGGSWYVVWSEARAEKRVAERLQVRGFDVWLPTVTERRRWSDRWKNVTLPLFPGYLFACTRGEGYVPILRVPGVLTLVKDGLRPVLLTPAYLEQLQALVLNPKVEVQALPESHHYAPGDEVLVREGPLTGWRGVVMELRGRRKLAVWVASVGRGLLCELGAASVTRVAAA